MLFDKNGKPRYDEGPIALISIKDIKPGPRHLKWLSNLEVKKIVE